jgi:hypothetical protein
MVEPFSTPGIDAQTFDGRRIEGGDRPNRGQEALAGSSALSRASMAWPDMRI